MTSPTDILAVALEALDDLKANDVRTLDVRKITSIADYMVVASGRSDRHVRSLDDSVVMQAKKHGVQPLGVEGEQEGEWVLVDLGDVIVHVMQPRTREFYSLEKLWDITSDDGQRGATAAE